LILNLSTQDCKEAVICLLPYILKPTRYLILTITTSLTDSLRLCLNPQNINNFYKRYNTFPLKHVVSLLRAGPFKVGFSYEHFSEEESAKNDITLLHIETIKDLQDVSPDLFDLIAIDSLECHTQQKALIIAKHFANAKLVFVDYTIDILAPMILNSIAAM
jgi:hypothetical protein